MFPQCSKFKTLKTLLQSFFILGLLHLTYSQDSVPNSCWSDLSLKEVNEVQNYMFKAFPEIVPIDNATVNSSYIYLIYIAEKEKKAALQHECSRSAIATVFFGSNCSKCPYVGEFQVYPTITPVKHVSLAEKSFTKRPVSKPESDAILKLLAKDLSKLNKLMQYAYGATFAEKCAYNTSTCLAYMATSPLRRPTGTGRTSWIRLHRNVLPLDHYPINFQALIAFDGNDVQKWKIEQIWMQGKYFSSPEELLQSFNNGSFVPKQLPFVRMPIHFIPGAETNITEPREPIKKLYEVKNNTVSFYKWNFHVAFRSLTALRLFNLTFNGKSVAYEVGLSEEISVYSGLSPYIQSSFFIETQYGIGSHTSSLWPGKDCPIDATYLPVTVYNEGIPQYIKRAICIFTQKNNRNLERHAEFDTPQKAFYYTAKEDRVLIVRSISTMYNYDYYFDYIFHKNGVMKSRTMLTGNIFTDVIENGQTTEFGYPSLKNPLLYEPFHHHMFSFKVDLDIMEAKNNVFKQVRIDKKKFDKGYWNEILVGRVPKTEKDAQMNYDEFVSHPRFNFICHTFGKGLQSAQKAEFYNNLTSLPCYKIVNNGLSKSLIPEDDPYEKGITWARYPISITKRKDSEWLDSSIYTCIDPVEPDLNFQNFIDDDENIIDEDLVAWVTVGFHHIPSSEDLPITQLAETGFEIMGSNFYQPDSNLQAKGK